MANRYVLDMEKYASLARQAAADGCVLLENRDGALPLEAGTKAALFGRSMFHYYKSGTGSGGSVNTRYVIGILDALEKEEGIAVDEEVLACYRTWLETHPFDQGKGWGQEPWSQEEMAVTEDFVKSACERNDAALVIIGRTAGEDQDARNEKGSYLLNDTELDLLRKVKKYAKRLIVILNVGSIIDMRWVKEVDPDAVLYVWQGGMEGGNGVADVLTGRVNPAGRLTDTIASSVEDYPSHKNFGDAVRNFYQEDIYVGYRYFETFAKDKVLYPFGFGLSYTTFAQEPLSLERDKTVKVCVKVRNTGRRAGREVVQAYAALPQGKLGKPALVLAGFGKTKCLAPGEETVLAIEIPDSVLASYDDAGATEFPASWVMEAGTYTICTGPHIRDLAPAGSFRLEETVCVMACSHAVMPVLPFERIRPAKEGENFVEVFEPVPTGAVAPKVPSVSGDVPAFAGDLGIRYADVAEGRAKTDAFLSQFSDEALRCLVRGEGMCSPKVTPGTAGAFGGVTEELKNFGLPVACVADGPSGIRMDCGTNAFSLPSGVCLASTFDEELLTELFSFEGHELRKNRIDSLLGPGMNIHRHPLNGRNFEYFSEDPLLTGKMAAAELRGIHRFGVTGTIKHFCANNQEFHRSDSDSVVSERALREIYLKGFEIAVKEGGARLVMTTYGMVNGQFTDSIRDLNTTILRGEWGFDGAVMTDWWANSNFAGEKGDRNNLAAMAMSGNDLYMVCSDALGMESSDNLKEMMEQGVLTRRMLLDNAEHIVGVLQKLVCTERALGKISEEETEAYASMEEGGLPEFDVTWYSFDNACEIETEGVSTEGGSQFSFGIIAGERGLYTLSFEAKIDASELAQVPVTFFKNQQNLGTKTLNGTNGAWVKVEQPLEEIFMPNNFVRLYFARSGMEIRSMKVEKTGEFVFRIPGE